MDIMVTVPSERKCPASIDWSASFSIATLSFGDLETPGTDVEVKFNHEQMSELVKVVNEANEAGIRGRVEIEAQKVRDARDWEKQKNYHGGSC